jgi:hypothetical protein
VQQVDTHQDAPDNSYHQRSAVDDHP